MPAEGFLQVGAEPDAIDRAREVAEKLSGRGLRFSKAHVLRRALALGLDLLAEEPARMVEPVVLPKRRKKTSA